MPSSCGLSFNAAIMPNYVQVVSGVVGQHRKGLPLPVLTSVD